MKLLLTFTSILLCFFNVFSQTNREGTPYGANSDGRLISVFENLKNKTKGSKIKTEEISGSPYFEESFKTAQIVYFGEILKENIYIRYNAYSDEMEMAKSESQTSSDDVLIKNKKITCTLNGYSYKYLAFIKENEQPAVGYVKELFRGNKFSLYVRETKEYKEGVKAKSSLEGSFPPRFIDKKDYYIALGDGSLKQTKLSKKHIVSTLSSYEQEIKSFINLNKVKLKNSSDVIKLFNFLEEI